MLSIAVSGGRGFPLDGAAADRLAYAAVAVAGAVASAAAAAVTLSGLSAEYAALQAVARAAMVGIPIAVGLYAVRQPASARFGRLLIAAGFGWFLTTLAESPDAVLYSVGRVSSWVVELSIIYLILAFPTGRLPARIDRVIVAVGVAILACLWLPTALLVDAYPLPAIPTACDDCPANAFQVVAREPAVVGDLIVPLRELLTIALAVCATGRLAWRMRHASPLAQRALGPVLGVASFRLVVFFVTIAARRVDPETAMTDVATWLLALAVPMLAVAFLVGVWRWRLFIAEAMQRLAVRLQGRHPRPAELRRALAEEFDDASLEVVRRAGGRWIDSAGEEVPEPAATPARALTGVFEDGERIAVLCHDPALADDAAFNATAASYVRMTLASERLASQTARLVSEVNDTRERARTAAAHERRRIEHDLHDGAQQRLIALRINLELAAERTEHLDPGAGARLRELGGEVERALGDIRALARGDRPVTLAEHGLVAALRAAADGAAPPVTVLGRGVRRNREPLEVAAYFCCLEAMQNAAKHARGATAVVVELADDDAVLRVDVSDDGCGFDADTVAAGSGLANLRERIAAVGGELSIHSRPGRGTRVSARIPTITPPG